MAATRDDTIAEPREQLAAARAERDAALAREAALAEVLDVINRSPGDPVPVFDAILEKAKTLCGAELGSLSTWDDEFATTLTRKGYSDDVEAIPTPIGQVSRTGAAHVPVLGGDRYSHVLDAAEVEIRPGEDEGVRRYIQRSGTRTWLMVPLRGDGGLSGFLTVARTVVRAFSDTEISMLESLAAQAVIAIENTRLLTKTREALEQQTATAEVLQVINASPGNLTPVFDAMLEKAMRLCGAAFGELYTFDGESFRQAANRGVPAAYAEFHATTPLSAKTGHSARMLETKRPIHILDVMDEVYRQGQPAAPASRPRPR